jgi:hypothetical protein
LLDKGNLDLKALYEYLDKVGMNCGFLVSCERSTSHVLSTCPSNDSPFPDPSRRCLVWNILVGPVNKWHLPCGPWWFVTSVLAPVGSLKPCSPCHPHACVCTSAVSTSVTQAYQFASCKVFSVCLHRLHGWTKGRNVGTESMPSRCSPVNMVRAGR